MEYENPAFDGLPFENTKVDKLPEDSKESMDKEGGKCCFFKVKCIYFVSILCFNGIKLMNIHMVCLGPVSIQFLTSVKNQEASAALLQKKYV